MALVNTETALGQPLGQQQPQDQFAVAGQDRVNALGALLGGLAQALAPGTWMGGVGQVGQAANEQLLKQQAQQKQTSQIGAAGAQQQAQLGAVLGALLGGGAAAAPAAAQPLATSAGAQAQPAAGGPQTSAPFQLAGLESLLSNWFGSPAQPLQLQPPQLPETQPLLQ